MTKTPDDKLYYRNKDGVQLRDFGIPAYDPKTRRTMYPHLRKVMRNIFTWFESNKMPETVYVVGAGPNGLPFYEQIPEGGYTISVNSLIKYPRVWDWWVCFDHRCPSFDYWNAPRHPKTKVLYGCRLCNRLDDDNVLKEYMPDYFFDYLPGLVPGTFFRNEPVEMPGILRGGMTAGGIAVQLAVYGGAKKIVLVGLDFKGRGHWDGVENPNAHYDGVWGESYNKGSSWADVLSNYMRYVEKRRKVEFVSWSETALAVKVVKP